MSTTAAWRDHVTIVEVLERTAAFAAFQAVTEAALHRLEREGIAALLSVQFYADPHTPDVGALITFNDYRRVMEHVAMITAWDEFQHLLDVVKLRDVRVYGPMGEDGIAWLNQTHALRNLFTTPLVGFVRPSVETPTVIIERN